MRAKVEQGPTRTFEHVGRPESHGAFFALGHVFQSSDRPGGGGELNTGVSD